MRALLMRRPAIVSLLVAMLALAGWQSATWQRSPLPLSHWGLAEIIAHLRDAGLDLRVVSTSLAGPVDRSAFLTRTDKTWLELSSTPAARHHIGRWKGTLFVRRCRGDAAAEAEIEDWGDSCAVAGPFVFFGDAELLGQVRVAIGEGAYQPLAQPSEPMAFSPHQVDNACLCELGVDPGPQLILQLRCKHHGRSTHRAALIYHPPRAFSTGPALAHA